MKKSSHKIATLEGQELLSYCCRNMLFEQCGHLEYTFYEPIHYRNVWFHVWSVIVAGPQPFRYYFSAYENGQIVQPDKDPRFAKVYRKRFDGKQWAECYFSKDVELVRFIQKTEL